MRHFWISCLALAAFAAPARAAEAPLSIAVAASSATALARLVSAYPGKPAPRVTVGATGKFYQQLRAGAPFDLLFAADDVYPKKLAAEQLSGAPRSYARGRLALWAAHGAFDPKAGLAGLKGAAVKHVAIANPAVAPYGQAAVATMKQAGVYEAVAPKLVQGESVAQAAQFVTMGAAEAGLLPFSLVLDPKLQARGSYWLVPARMHPALDAQAVVLKSSQHQAAAAAFLAYVTGPKAAAVWRSYGFEPAAKP